MKNINKKFVSDNFDNVEVIIDKIRGSIFGCAIGDALGMPLEFQKKSELERIGKVKEMLPGNTLNGHDNFKELPAGTWTDDTSMMLCLANSLLEKGFDQKDQVEKYRNWLYNGYCSCAEKSIGSGGATRNAIQNFCKTGQVVNGDNTTLGNGSIMRILPIPIYYMEDALECAYFASESAKVTHNNSICKSLTAMFSLYIREAFLAKEKQDIKFKKLIKIEESIANEEDIFTIYDLISKGNSGNVVFTYSEAIKIFKKSNSFSSGIIKAINEPGDSDTLGAVVGSLSGAFYGYKEIPKKWIDELKHKEMLEDCCERFIKMFV